MSDLFHAECVEIDHPYRQTWHEYFFDIARKVATRSTCVRRHVGSVAVNKYNRIIGTGYNGAPSGLEHCTKETCIRTVRNIPSGSELSICKGIHSEQNIILQLGERLEDGSLYCTNKPCTICLKLLMGVKIAHIYWLQDYDDEYSDILMKEYGYIDHHEINGVVFNSLNRKI